MSINDVVKSIVTEVTGPNEKQSAAGVEDGNMGAEKRKAKLKDPDLKRVDPEEVQYPSYLKDGGSL